MFEQVEFLEQVSDGRSKLWLQVIDTCQGQWVEEEWLQRGLLWDCSAHTGLLASLPYC